jgi:hypothetical protein
MEDTLFTVLPFCYNVDIVITPELECSNKFYIHYTHFDKMIGDDSAGELLLYELKTPGGTIVGTPIGPHLEGTNYIFVPTWMWDALKEAEEDVVCMLEPCHPSMASMIALEPHTSDLLKCKDPETALRNAFEQYSCIKKGGTYPLQLEDLPNKVWVTIPAVTPDIKESLCIRNVELIVNMLPARDAPLPIAPVVPVVPVVPVGGAGSPPPRSVSRFAHPPGFVAFSGTGNTLGGK